MRVGDIILSIDSLNKCVGGPLIIVYGLVIETSDSGIYAKILPLYREKRIKRYHSSKVAWFHKNEVRILGNIKSISLDKFGLKIRVIDNIIIVNYY